MSKSKPIRAHATINAIKFDCAQPVAIKAAEGEGTKGPATFDVTAYTGVELTVEGYNLPIVLDLASAKTGKSIIANLDHQLQQRVGHVTETRNDGKQLEFAGVASASTPFRDEVVNSSRDGFAWQASIEAQPAKVETIRRGDSIEVNGRKFNGPIYVARGAVVRGFAFVSHGADDNTQVAIAAQQAASQKEGKTMTPELKAWIVESGFDPDNLSEKQLASLTATFNGQKAPAAPAPLPPSTAKSLDEIVAAQKAENRRQEEINGIAAIAIKANPRNTDAIYEIARKAIAEGTTPEQLKAHLYDLAPQSHTINPPRQREGLSDDVLEAALCINGMLPNLNDAYKGKEHVLEAADKFQQRHGRIGLKDLLCIGAESQGEHVSRSNVSAMLEAAFPPRGIKAGFSTLSIPNILSNTANKFLMSSFNAVESAWREISAIRSVSDFKAVTSYRLTGAFQYEKVGAGGELKHGTVGETSFTNQAATYGKMFAITRTDIVNDDLGALTQVPSRLGRGAALALNDVFWTAFLADSSIFPTNDSKLNYYADAAATLSMASLKVLERKFMKQIDEDSKPLALMPSILLVPPEEWATARELMQSTGVNTGGSSSTAQVPNTNIFQGKYRPVVSTYLSNTSYTGYSTTAWYLIANPADLALIEVAFLNGKDTPTVETADADFNVLGIQMRGYHDFGVSFVDYRAGQKSKGAA